MPPATTVSAPTAGGGDVEAQIPVRSAPSSPASTGPDHHARSLDKESLDLVARRIKRSQTSRSFRPKLAGRQWKPGEEPGIDPSGPHSGTVPVNLHTDCQITVVDFGQQDMEVRELDNSQLADFLAETKDEGLTCRWINVNGLSWDVISLLGKEKKFHRLAIEDMLHSRNRTKADWYSDHTYMVLPLQKLVHVHDEDCEDEEDSESRSLKQERSFSRPPLPPRKKKKSWWQRMAHAFKSHHDPYIPHHEVNPSVSPLNKPQYLSYGQTPAASSPNFINSEKLRTLQRYQGGSNIERSEYMERNSALRPRGLAVSVEQVSIFLTADNTVVSFFEHSADDIEAPIINRLCSRETVIRRSGDASMLVQAILDAIIDLAIPVTFAYKDAIDELELNVLTEPIIEHTRSLYILISEIATFRANISPVANLVNALRDHRTNPVVVGAATTGAPPTLPSRQPSANNVDRSSISTVTITSTTYTYLGDVEDHILLITDGVDQMRRAADNMIDLIFNTISAYQNEAMRQLTTVTIVFLPLSFLSGYFGMNFHGSWPALDNGDYYFWWIATPVCVAVTLLLLRDAISRWWDRARQRQRVRASRKKRGTARDGSANKAKSM